MPAPHPWGEQAGPPTWVPSPGWGGTRQVVGDDGPDAIGRGTWGGGGRGMGEGGPHSTPPPPPAPAPRELSYAPVMAFPLARRRRQKKGASVPAGLGGGQHRGRRGRGGNPASADCPPFPALSILRGQAGERGGRGRHTLGGVGWIGFFLGGRVGNVVLRASPSQCPSMAQPSRPGAEGGDGGGGGDTRAPCHGDGADEKRRPGLAEGDGRRTDRRTWRSPHGHAPQWGWRGWGRGGGGGERRCSPWLSWPVSPGCSGVVAPRLSVHPLSPTPAPVFGCCP